MSQRQDEGKALPIGTIRDWKKGQVVKTARGWEPVSQVPMSSTAQDPASSAGAASSPTPASLVLSAADIPKSRKMSLFSPQKMAQALAAFHADPANPQAQQEIRSGLRRLCADYGMMDRDDGSPDEMKFGYLDDKYGNSILGVHTWEGGILARPDEVKHAWKECQRLGGDPTREKKVKYAHGLHVLVHESVHGHSPIVQGNFKGRFRLLEEATTEMAARKIDSEISGIPMSEFSKIGAYGDFCSALYQGTKAALARFGIGAEPPDVWYDMLGEACIEMRRRPPPQDKNKQQYTRRFAASLPLPADKIGDKMPQVTEEVAKAVWMSLAPAKEKEKLFRLMGARLKAKDPQEVLLLDQQIAAQKQTYETAQQEWQAYLDGKAAATESRRDRMARILIEASSVDEDAGMLPRNNLPEAILYARVLSSQGELTEDALRDLALLQDNVSAAANALNKAVAQYGLTVSEPKPVAVGSLLF